VKLKHGKTLAETKWSVNWWKSKT